MSVSQLANFKIASPKQVIERLVTNEFKSDADFIKLILNIVFNGNPNKMKARCMAWRHEWGLDPFYSPVYIALDTVCAWYFNATTLPNEVGPMKDNVLHYIKGVKDSLLNGIYKYACKHPPETVEMYPLSAEDLIEFSLSILDKFV